MNRAERELEMWKTWKAQPTQENLEPLMDSLMPLINQKVGEYRAAPVPPIAIRAAANAAVMRALNSYQPNKGAALGTHVFTHLKKVNASVGKYQNIGRIPSHRLKKITPFKVAREELTESLGRPPDTVMLADHLGWSIKETARMEKELGLADHIASKQDPVDLEDEDEKEEEVLRYIHEELDVEERAVFEYTLGIGGKPKLKAGEIATVMNISKPKVSRIRNKISAKLEARGI